jgi:hypothetical protein
MSTGERPPRRYDIDWRRIAAVLLLIPYHTSRVFNTGEQFYAKNVPESAGINLSTLTWTLVVYELAVRRWNPMRTLFGMKRRRVTLAE